MTPKEDQFLHNQEVGVFVIKIDNNDSYEVFVLFVMGNLCVNSYDEIFAVIANLVDDIASYSKDLLK